MRITDGVFFFGLSHHTFRVALVVFFVLENHIVVAANVEHLKMRVVNFPIPVPSAESLGDGTCCITFQDGIFQQFCGVNHADFLALNYLITNASRNN